MHIFSRFRGLHDEFFSRTAIANLAALPIAAFVLYWIAQNSGPRTGSVIVDVFATDVSVSVGSHPFRFEEFTGVPIICELPVGRHRMLMKQGETVLHDVMFTVKGGEEHILCAWPSLAQSSDHPAMRLNDAAWFNTYRNKESDRLGDAHGVSTRSSVVITDPPSRP